MSMNERTRLERLAVRRHRAGTTWPDFWDQHRLAVLALFPRDHYAYHRLARRLLALLVSGDTDGQQPIDAGYGRPLDFEIEAIEATR